MVLSVISESVLNTARQLNERDAKLANSDHKENYRPDDDYWADVKDAEGHKGAEGQLKSEGGSKYSYGPYPRNRRILADVALSAGWDVGKTKDFENRIVVAAAKWYYGCEQMRPATIADWDFSTAGEKPIRNGKPFTFQHIAWDRLTYLIPRHVKDMDPGKEAAVKAGVLDMYEKNSKTGKKKLPPRGTKRKSSGGPGDEQVQAAQDEIDRAERYRTALLSEIEPGFRSPAWIKKHLQHLIDKGEFTLQTLSEMMEVSEEAFRAFQAAKKKQEQYESKVYHAGVALFRERAPGRTPSGERPLAKSLPIVAKNERPKRVKKQRRA